MKRIALAILMTTAATALLAETPGVVVWSSSNLKSYSKTLASKVDAKKLALERLSAFANHAAMIAHREGDGEAELHEKQVDFLIVESGAATLVVGGTIVDGKTTAPGEIRGASIKGGERHSLSSGDIVHIEAKVPHQLLVASGQELTYFVIKVDTPQ
jgi:mannose-6-phosphate isomerase-like protein (cupin superfamily)